jgi:hypothetical protein
VDEVLPVFQNQVAGHFPLLSRGGAIYKPLNTREQSFYTELQQGFPGLLQLASSKLKQRQHEKKNEWPGMFNKWALHVQHKKRAALDQTKMRYLVLEDLTYPFICPCIMDLKLGIRQHGMNESKEKIASKIDRCLKTTSSKIGLRLSGMQVYHEDQEQYSYQDKYFGRSLDTAGFEGTLWKFLCPDQQVRTDIVEQLLAKLTALRQQLSTITGARFWSSSLLIVYEGCTDQGRIKFQRAMAATNRSAPLSSSNLVPPSARATKSQQTQTQGPTPALAVRTSKRRATIQSRQTSTALAVDSLDDLCSRYLCRHTPMNADQSCAGCKETAQVMELSEEANQQPAKVDVRLIDFAHVAVLPARVAEAKRADEGALLGLDFLIEQLHTMMKIKKKEKKTKKSC